MAPEVESSSVSTRILDRAVRHVSDYWFPISPAVAERIQRNLADGTYEEDIDLLLADIKSDYSLFTQCLGGLRKLVDENDDFELKNCPSDMLDALRHVEAARLEEFLLETLSHSSQHSLEGASELQNARLQESLLSSAAAELMADSEDLDGNQAAAAALLRQLGHTLVAWNYPGVYEEAVKVLQSCPTMTLDEALAMKLGFRPQLLALRIVQTWGLPKELAEAMEDQGNPSNDEAHITNGVAGTLATICRVSEALARANCPQVYPSARGDWKVASREIERRIGTRGMEKIRTRFVETCREYITSVPTIFRGALILDEDFTVAAVPNGTNTSCQRNPYISHCDKYVRNLLVDLYEGMEGNWNADAMLRTLVKDIIPTARFSGGFIYTVDPSVHHLRAQLEIGSPELRCQKPIAFSEGSDSDDPIVQAFMGSFPLVVTTEPKDGLFFTTLAAPLGRSQRLGAVYLEMPSAVFNSEQRRHTVHFKALCQAINDCLRVS